MRLLYRPVFYGRVARIRLSGSAWRVLFWSIRELSRRKHARIPLSWHRIANELKLNGGSVVRAGRDLVRAGLVLIQDDRIRLRRKLARLQAKRNSYASRRSSSKTDVKKQRF